jgi:hypothetical protein
MKMEKHNEVKWILNEEIILNKKIVDLTYYHYTLLIILQVNELFDHVLNHPPL